ncbi:MAG: sigma 54-interacting transcriptional regulator [Desulfuromonadaceae bacterium]|nr:sigma 54-interacting transcriptional regulator [Desulfuromonadaceae bacterium]
MDSDRNQKIIEGAQIDRLKFEALLSDLSATFINVHVSEVDGKIEQGLRRIVEFLGIDRSTVWKVSPEGKMLCTHSFARAGIKPPPDVISNMVPVWETMVHHGEIFEIADVDELPESQWREKEYCREQGGIKSIMFLPASVGGIVVGFITFVSYAAKRAWPEDLINRLRLLWDVFTNALERKLADQKIQKALEEIKILKDRLEVENLYLRDQIEIEYKHEEIIGRSDVIRRVLLRLEQVAVTDSTVLILGETGTGKELIARAIHNSGSRRNRAMIKVNCAALPSALIEAELFGREKGAYTGAVTKQIGRFEAADGSTIFLDEIGDLPLELQAKLLRVIQEGQFERLGNPHPIDVDVRVIAATNRNLALAVKEGRFREDLYYRLNVFPISVPPLRERREDIPLLVWAMVEEFSRNFDKKIERISKKSMEAMELYQWPGNIRELRNVVERAMILSNGPSLIVDVPDISAAISAPSLTIAEMERRHIISVLDRTRWRVRGKNGAADILGLKPTTLDSKMKKLSIKRNDSASEI